MELVDEYEELELVLAHYALAWGSNIQGQDGEDEESAGLQRDLASWGLHNQGES